MGFIHAFCNKTSVRTDKFRLHSLYNKILNIRFKTLFIIHVTEFSGV